MAVQAGQVGGERAASWLSMQHAYDVWHAERVLVKELEQIPAHAS